MIFLVSFIHCVFLAIFFFFHRYVEMAIILGLWGIFISKIVPPLDIFVKRTKFPKKKILESDVLEQSLYLSSGVLFYTALIGVSLGGANILGLPADLRLLDYCVFFLTCSIFGVYLLTYPNNPNSFILFRIHCIIAGLLLNSVVLLYVFFGVGEMTFFTTINLLLVIFGIFFGFIFDKGIPLSVNIFSIYLFIATTLCLVLGATAFLFPPPSFVMLLFLGISILLYFLFPPFLSKSRMIKQIPFLSWHFRNSILTISWAVFGFAVWTLFWGNAEETLYTIFICMSLLGFWLYIYATEKGHPVFFAGTIAIAGALTLFLVFCIFPQIFWIVISMLFIFSGGLLLLSVFFKNRPEELILALGAVIFLCTSDVVLVFQDNNLFAIALLFLFQSLIWYGAYEIFHRQANVKKRAL